MSIQDFIKHLNKCTSPFALRMGDISIARSIWDFPPEAFLERFISERNKAFDIDDSSPPLEYAKQLLEYEPNTALWKNLKDIKDISAIETSLIPEELRDRLRGFRDQHLNITIEEYRRIITSNITKVNNTIDAIRQTQVNLDRNKDKGKYYYFGYHLDQLEIRRKHLLSQADESNLAQRSANRLMRENNLFSVSRSVAESMADIDICQPIGYINIIDLRLDNPYRHLDWPVPTFMEIEESWHNNKDDAHAIEIIERDVNIFDTFQSLIEEPFLKKRKQILYEILQSASIKCYTSSTVLLFTQIEGLLFDLALEINNKEFNGVRMVLFPDPSNTKIYYSNRKKGEEDVISIERFLFDSQYKDFFWPGFLEYFASDFYAERCKMAHGEIHMPVTELDLKKLMLYALSILIIYGEYISTGNAPVLSTLHRSDI